jgi:hypothetical protein
VSLLLTVRGQQAKNTNNPNLIKSKAESFPALALISHVGLLSDFKREIPDRHRHEIEVRLGFIQESVIVSVEHMKLANSAETVTENYTL